MENNTNRGFAKAYITPKGERMLRDGHPWVYADEVTNTPNAEDGELVDVLSQKDRYLGTGFINSRSKIRIRVISDNANDRFDEAFFERRVKYAVDYRRTVMGEDFSACRLIFGEADRFPGLTVDRFDNVLVAQTLSLGIEKRKNIIFPAIVKYLRECGERIDIFYERNDVAIRELEGMKEYKAFYTREGLDLSSEGDGFCEITENGIRYTVDYMNGQKTGFFLDQKYNRMAIRRIAKGRRVLDCFTHTGAFALNAAAAQAESVTAVDVSELALDAANKNAAMNGFTNFKTLKADVFELLTNMCSEKRHDFDFIILDPPAFTKSRSTVKDAYRGYKDINYRAMKILPRGGYLATCSCSHFMPNELFVKMLRDAAHDAAVTLRQIEERRQSPDHPILWNVPETEYLKFYIFQIV